MLLFYKMFQIDLSPPANSAHLSGKGHSKSIKPEGILSNFCFHYHKCSVWLKNNDSLEKWSLSALSTWGKKAGKKR